MAKIDFSKTAHQVNGLIRGLITWPTAYFFYSGSRIKVYKACVCEGKNAPCGTVIASNGRLVVQCADNTAIEILELAPEGKSRMTAAAMLNGKKIPEGTNLNV